MRTLLIESTPGAGAAASAMLAAAEHSVVRCHEADTPSFPCAALTDPLACPLAGPTPADVVVVARAHTDAAPTAAEAGVSCAIKLGIPVVVLAPMGANPFEGFATSAGSEYPPEACEQAVDAAHERTVAPLRAEVVRMLEAGGLADAAGSVTVDFERDGTRVQIDVEVPHDSPVEPETIATHVRDRFRATAPAGLATATVTDVSVHTSPPPEA